jgi:beta-lactamase class D
LKMDKTTQRVARLAVIVLLLTGGLLITVDRADAGVSKTDVSRSQREKSSTTSTRKVARQTGSGPRSSRRSSSRKQTARSKKAASSSLTRGRKRQLTAERTSGKSGRSRANSRRALARARALARLRVLRANDAALRNIAATNIQKDITTGEDMEIRRVSIDALDGRAGTVVIMDPNNGRIYTIVNQQMGLGSPVKPCSTVKMVVGLAALHDGVFDPNQDVQISSRSGMNLTDALARSNNPVFQVLGRLLGHERVIYYAENFGFGRKTGVNYPGESAGFLPEQGEQETGHMSSHGDNFGVTAMQLATFTAAVANGGNLYVPRTPRTPEEVSTFTPVLNRKIDISAEDRLRVMGGMIGAVNYGTGRLAYNPLGQVAGKTGTCTGNRDKLGLFTSFSSVDNPRLVVTVITTGYQEAGRRAAEIAGRIYAAISQRFLQNKGVPAGSGLEINN